MDFVKTVFHIHTDYSDDSNNSVDHLLASAQQAGVHCLAVTDHDTIDGARALVREARGRVRIIVGEEISTMQGDLIGLFIKEHIPPYMSVRATAEAIKRQGGLVVVPHPFNMMFDCGLRDAVYDILDLIDVVEIANAQNILPFPNRRAQAFAQKHGFPDLVGVDTHHRGSLTRCYQWLPPFSDAGSFLASIRRAQYVMGQHRWSYFLQTAAMLLRSRAGFGVSADYGRNCPQARPKHRPSYPTIIPVPVEDSARHYRSA